MLKFALMKVEKSGAWNDSILSIAFKQVHLLKNLPTCLFLELKNQLLFVYLISC